MSDPWERFVRVAEQGENVGYFERSDPDPERAGLARWFTDVDEHVTLTTRSTPDELDRGTGRFLRRHPRGNVLGYLGFDAVGLFEPLLADTPSGSPFPLGELAYVLRPQTARVPHLRRGPGSIRRTSALRPRADTATEERFGQGVRRLQRAIRDGDAYQVVLSHRRRWDRPKDLLARAGRLRAEERFAFFFYLRFGDRELVGASPESVVELSARRAYINPIAGTRPTGKGRAGRLRLTKDPKELAEHRMLVDLARNDLGRIAEPGSVRLISQEREERFARLEHLVSRVGARVRRGVSPWSVLGATFPAGTVSGAPKIRATQLLRREERSWRGPYGGAVGFMDGHDRSCWALAIRTAFASGPHLYTAAGAGIVHRSQPRREYLETRLKLAQVEAVLLGDPDP